MTTADTTTTTSSSSSLSYYNTNSNPQRIIDELSLIFDPVQSDWKQLLYNKGGENNEAKVEVEGDDDVKHVSMNHGDNNNSNGDFDIILRPPRPILKASSSKLKYPNKSSLQLQSKVSFSTLQIREFDSSNAASQHSMNDSRFGWWTQFFCGNNASEDVKNGYTVPISVSDLNCCISEDCTAVSSGFKVGYGTSPRDVAEIPVDDYEQYKATGDRSSVSFLSVRESMDQSETTRSDDDHFYDYDGSDPVFYMEEVKGKKKSGRSNNENSKQVSHWLRCCKHHTTDKCNCPPVGLKRAHERLVEVSIGRNKELDDSVSSKTIDGKNIRGKTIITGRVLFQRPATNQSQVALRSKTKTEKYSETPHHANNDHQQKKKMTFELLDPPKDTFSSLNDFQDDIRNMQRSCIISGKSLLVGSC